MKKILLIILALFILGVAGALAFFLTNRQDVSVPAEVSVPDPFGGALAGGTPTSSGAPETADIRIALQDGSVVTVPDFTKSGQPSWAGPSGYLVVGGPSETYMATYLPADQSGAPAEFSIILQSEPLGETRLTAERALREKLRLTNDQLCGLGVAVYTQPRLSDIYDAQNLGLSFCPGSVKLP